MTDRRPPERLLLLRDLRSQLVRLSCTVCRERTERAVEQLEIELATGPGIEAEVLRLLDFKGETA
jgi:hypothetical protein